MRYAIASVAVVFALSGCASLQRAQIAKEASNSMIGLQKEAVLSCMGPPQNKAAEGSTEVWSYQSGNGFRDFEADGYGSAVSTARFCTVNIVMTGGVVSAVNYSGPTGGLLSQGEQCAFAVQRCLPSKPI